MFEDYLKIVEEERGKVTELEMEFGDCPNCGQERNKEYVSDVCIRIRDELLDNLIRNFNLLNN